MKKALISVYHKENIAPCARLLKEAGWEIISTGGTSRFLRENGVETIDVSALTGFPEILDGRVKTLHPHVFAPILAKKSDEHLSQLRQFRLDKIDLVVVNFYPFEESLLQKEKGLDFMIEKIDIGGPSMVRAAAKNFTSTIVVVDSLDYMPVVEALIKGGDIDFTWRKNLAQKAFAYTSFYDSLIAKYLCDEAMPTYTSIAGRLVAGLRYGENPHQKASLYSWDMSSPFYKLQQLQGKELSFNNILDTSTVYEVLGEFPTDRHFTVIIKHQNPCGAAMADTQVKAFQRAVEGDPKSAYGGIVGFNTPLTGETAAGIKEIFFEVIIAPEFMPDALVLLQKRKNLRLLKMALGYEEKADVRIVPGGFLFQERDLSKENTGDFELKTKRKPLEAEIKDIAFGWKLIRFVKSNAIIIVKDEMLVGVGAGQMSRVDAVELAIRKCQIPPEGAVLISDAFFPFPDSIELAAHYGITAAVEPGGSVKDDEVIATAEKFALTLLFTGVRHFRH